MRINLKSAAITLLFISILSLNVFRVHAGAPSESHNADSMWIEPSSIDLTTASVGYLFNITVSVNISTTTQVGVWQVKLLFNPTYVQAVRTDYTEVGKSNWFSSFTTIPVDATINNVTGYVLHGESLTGAAVNSPGAGTLFWIEFNLTAIPPSNLAFDITSTYALGTTYIGDDVDVPFTPYDGTGIIPEFPAPVALMIFMLATFATVVLAKKKIQKPNIIKQ